MSENVFINIKNRSLSITADVEIPEGGANGVILAQAGRFGGWSLYLKDGKPTYCYNFLGLQEYKVAAPQALAAGKATIRMNFDYDGGGVGKGGTATILVNGEKVASGRIERTQPTIFSADETAGVGVDDATPVTTDYKERDNAFTGKILKVTVDVKPIGAAVKAEADAAQARGRGEESLVRLARQGPAVSVTTNHRKRMIPPSPCSVTLKTVCSLALAAACLSNSRAGEPVAPQVAAPPAADHSGWEFTLTAYVPMTGLDGTVGVAPFLADVDMPFSEVIDNLDAGFMVYMNARNDRWSITGDFMWTKLSASLSPTRLTEIDFRQEQITTSLALGYSLVSNDRTTLDLLAGVVYNWIDVELDVSNPAVPALNGSRSSTQDWLEPFVGIACQHQLSEHWMLFGRADVGGFADVSDEYWQVMGGVVYHFNENIAAALVNRWISFDYHDRSVDLRRHHQRPVPRVVGAVLRRSITTSTSKRA